MPPCIYKAVPQLSSNMPNDVKEIGKTNIMQFITVYIHSQWHDVYNISSCCIIFSLHILP